MYKNSRFGRDYIDAGKYIQKFFPLQGIRFIAINDNIDTNRNDQTDDLIIPFKNLINDSYCRDLSIKLRGQFRIQRTRGEYVGAYVAYGYLKDKDDKHKLVIDEFASDIVRQIFAWKVGGYSQRVIAERLNQMTVPAPADYKRQMGINYKSGFQVSSQSKWGAVTVTKILKNRIYTGDAEVFKSHVQRVGSNRVRQIPLEQRTVIENTHEAIISREDFFSARAVVKSNKKSKGTPSQEVLTGYLVCGCCGNKMSNGKKQNRFYYCNSARYLPGGDCDKVRISKDRMKEIVYHAVKMQIDVTDMHMRQREKLLGTRTSKARENAKKQKNAETRLNKSKDEVMSLYEDYVSGIVSKEEFLEGKKRLAEEQDILIQLIRQLEKDAKVITLDSQNTDQEMERLRFKSSTELSAEMMKAFVKQVTVMPDQSINIEWNFKMDDSIASLFREDEETG